MLTRAGQAPWIAFGRMFAGLILLYEVFLGGWWKLGTPSTGPNPEWIGPAAGTTITETSARAIEEGTYGWYAWLLELAVLPHAELWSIVATVVQLLVGIALVFGILTRPAALVGLLYFFPVFHFGTIRTSPTFAVPIAFAFVANAGYYYGVDGWLAQSGREGLYHRIASFQPVPERLFPALAAGCALASVAYLLSIPQGTDRIALVGLELAVFFAILGAGLVGAYRGGEPIGLAADSLRAFVGYRFLHEIVVRTEPGVNGLPGWASGSDLAPLFADLAAGHVAPLALVIESAILPAVGAWALVFAVVQTAVGLALLAGWRTRFFGTVGAVYLAVLITLGFTRLAPLFLGTLVVATALGGRYGALD
ncbi:MAG: DoxX family membrane protein, partial [Halalkalicoccus sp.]